MDLEEAKECILKELQKHKSRSDCWLWIHGALYDVTEFYDRHPGGGAFLVETSGQEGTEAFESIGHSIEAKELMLQYKIDEASLSDELQKALRIWRLKGICNLLD